MVRWGCKPPRGPTLNCKNWNPKNGIEIHCGSKNHFPMEDLRGMDLDFKCLLRRCLDPYGLISVFQVRLGGNQWICHEWNPWVLRSEQKKDMSDIDCRKIIPLVVDPQRKSKRYIFIYIYHTCIHGYIWVYVYLKSAYTKYIYIDICWWTPNDNTMPRFHGSIGLNLFKIYAKLNQMTPALPAAFCLGLCLGFCLGLCSAPFPKGIGLCQLFAWQKAANLRDSAAARSWGQKSTIENKYIKQVWESNAEHIKHRKQFGKEWWTCLGHVWSKMLFRPRAAGQKSRWPIALTDLRIMSATSRVMGHSCTRLGYPTRPRWTQTHVQHMCLLKALLPLHVEDAAAEHFL